MTDFVTLAQYRKRWWFHMPLASQDGPNGPWGEILTGPEGTHGDDVEYLFSATAEDGPMIVAEHNAALKARQEMARYRTALEKIANSRPGGHWDGEWYRADPSQDLQDLRSLARAALSTPDGAESSGGR